MTEGCQIPLPGSGDLVFSLAKTLLCYLGVTIVTCTHFHYKKIIFDIFPYSSFLNVSLG